MNAVIGTVESIEIASKICQRLADRFVKEAYAFKHVPCEGHPTKRVIHVEKVNVKDMMVVPLMVWYVFGFEDAK